MKIHNTLSGQLEEIDSNQPTIYTCGPTVYDYPHIGNWFTFIRYDLLVRTLKAAGRQPVWVLNITDVGHLVSDADEGEDKLEKGARREGKSAWDIANFYTNYFIKGLERLNISKPDHLPRATDHIGEQIDMIQKLEDKGYAYKIDDGVYYDTAKFPHYADFARLDLDEQQAGARVEHNPQKRNPADFALWKFSPNGQQRDMEWDSPWGKGFPGWHLECSAMALKYLGETIDIHCGGIDHIPVHHTNEIAQSEAVTGKPLARCWMHTNHILIDDQKIAKSERNGITLEDLEASGYNLEAFRFLVLQSHYRTQSAFSWETLQAAGNRLKTLQAAADLRHQGHRSGGLTQLDLDDYKSKILTHMNNDLDTPQALVVLNTVADELQLLGSEQGSGVDEFWQFIDYIFGTKLMKDDITNEQKQLISQRDQAKQKQDWRAADSFRQHLAQQGIEINDTARGPIWYRK